MLPLLLEWWQSLWKQKGISHRPRTEYFKCFSFKFIFNRGTRPPSLFACFSEVLHPFPLAKGDNLGGSHYQKVALPCEATWSSVNSSQKKAEEKPMRLQRKCSGVVPCGTWGSLDLEKDSPQTWNRRLLHHIIPFISSNIVLTLIWEYLKNYFKLNFHSYLIKFKFHLDIL